MLPARLARVLCPFLVAVTALLAATAARALTPSPADWRDVVLYQVITDRFANGDPANDALEGGYVPSDGAKTHGGDFAGLTQKLDYLQHLGVSGVWISPVSLNANGEYHGYATRDFRAIAPHFGSMAELRALADSLHARGMVLVLDVIVNHMGDLIDSGSPGYPTFSGTGYTLRWRNAAKRHAGFFDDLSRFHANGGIQNWVDPDQVLGEIFSLDDLKTEDAAVRAELADIATYLIDATDCDGFRLDTAKHVEMGFWQSYGPAVHAAAAARGKSRFFLFGEVFDGSDAKNASYTGTVGGGPYKLDAVVHYPMYYATNSVFASGAGAPQEIADRWSALAQYDSTSREQLVTFLDNHDNSRFLGSGLANQDEGRLRPALAFLLSGRGVPCLYYGTEQEFDGGGDPWCREDMWDGQWDFGPSDGDNFDLTHPLFQWTRAWNDHRVRHLSLRRGATTVLAATSGGPGVLAYQRVAAGDTTVVALNSGTTTVVSPLAGPWPAGTPLVVWSGSLDPVATLVAGAGGAIELSLPPQAAWLLAREDAAAARTRLDVAAVWPGHDQAVSDLASPLRVRFETPVDAASLTAGFAITPPVAGNWIVQATLARFFPQGGWPSGVSFAWRLAPGVHDVAGRPLRARFDATFRTAANTSGITVPVGFAVDRIARQGLTAPEGIAFAAGAAHDRLLLADTGRDRLFTLTPGGDLGHAYADSRWSRPEGLAIAPDGSGDVRVTDPGGAFAVSDTAVRLLVAGSNTTSRGSCAIGPAAYGGLLYVGDTSADRIASLQNGVFTTFAANVRGAEGLAFGPGGAWGTDLYAADANLTSLGTSGAPANGLGRIVRVAANGTVTTLVTNTMLNGACALAFDRSGRFGGDLFVADILAERILRVTPAGAVSVFATGFKNLASSCALAFGPDDALYVADPASAQSFSNTSGANQPCAVYRIASQTVPVGVAPPSRRPLGLGIAPNPATGATTVRFTLPAPARATLAVYDAAGRRVVTLVDGPLAAGEHDVRWEGRDAAGAPLAPGVYFARLRAGGETVVRRVARVR